MLLSAPSLSFPSEGIDDTYLTAWGKLNGILHVECSAQWLLFLLLFLSFPFLLLPLLLFSAVDLQMFRLCREKGFGKEGLTIRGKKAGGGEACGHQASEGLGFRRDGLGQCGDWVCADVAECVGGCREATWSSPL